MVPLTLIKIFKEVFQEMVQTEKKTRFMAGPVTFIARHELWDGNIQDHADQGVSIVVAGNIGGKDTALLGSIASTLKKAISMVRRIPT